MFRIIGNKEELREPLMKFVSEVNNQVKNGKDKFKESLRERLSLIKMDSVADKITIPDTIVALEEVEDGFIIKTLFSTDNKILKKLFFMSFKKGKKSLEGYLKAVGIKKFKIVRM